jgi:hypothetical protein
MERTIDSLEPESDLITLPVLRYLELAPIRASRVNVGDIGRSDRERIVYVGVVRISIALELPHSRDFDVVPRGGVCRFPNGSVEWTGVIVKFPCAIEAVKKALITIKGQRGCLIGV